MGRVRREPTGPLPRARCSTCGRAVPVSTCSDGHQVYRAHRRAGRTCDGSRRSLAPDVELVPGPPVRRQARARR